jgi:bifunctional non-homologous end joining protein LigD
MPPRGHHATTPSTRVGRSSLAELVAGLPLPFRLTNLDKVLYPDQGITKAGVIAYLAVVAEWMIPHLADRPLTLLRCPDGHGTPCFLHRQAAKGMPSTIHAVPAAGDPLICIDDVAGLLGLAQLGTLEIHTWSCRAPELDTPDRLVLDLDPGPGVGWHQLAEAAIEIRDLLADLDLASFVTTTGGKGLHVVVPLLPIATWAQHKLFARTVAQLLAVQSPETYTANPLKAHRVGRIFVDYLRNSRGATAIAPYSMRARPGAPVATPVEWDALDQIKPETLTMATLPRWLDPG